MSTGTRGIALTAWLLASFVPVLATACDDSETPAGVGPSSTPARQTISIEPLELSLKVGEAGQLHAKVDGVDAIFFPGMIWSTSDPSVAIVSPAGMVSAQAEGFAVITAALQNSNAVARVVVGRMNEKL
jgi:uncharacterized protein YjdB